MTGRYITELADVLRGAGLAVIEYGEWWTRARGSGGYAAGRPWCVAWHHTASSASPESDAAYIATGAPDAPLANLLVDRDGVVWVLAAGCTNTNGTGGPLTFSRGTVPADSMNTYAVGMEIANNGVGESYTAAQIAAAFAASLAICASEALEPTDAFTHAEYAPSRKIDPATADAACNAGFCPSPINSSGTWSAADLRAELAYRAGIPPAPEPGPTPTPPPLEEDDTVLVVALDQNGTAWIGDGMTRFALTDGAVFDRYVLVHRGRLLNVSGGTVAGWADVGTVDGVTLEALGRD